MERNRSDEVDDSKAWVTYRCDGLRNVNENQSDRESPRLALPGPHTERGKGDKIAHQAADDHERILRSLVLLKPVVDRFCVVMSVIQKALDFNQRHVRYELHEREDDDEEDDDDCFENFDAFR